MLLGRPRRRREDIRMDKREMGLEGVERIHVANRDLWRALVNTVSKKYEELVHQLRMLLVPQEGLST